MGAALTLSLLRCTNLGALLLDGAVAAHIPTGVSPCCFISGHCPSGTLPQREHDSGCSCIPLLDFEKLVYTLECVLANGHALLLAGLLNLRRLALLHIPSFAFYFQR